MSSKHIHFLVIVVFNDKSNDLINRISIHVYINFKHIILLFTDMEITIWKENAPVCICIQHFLKYTVRDILFSFLNSFFHMNVHKQEGHGLLCSCEGKKFQSKI